MRAWLTDALGNGRFHLTLGISAAAVVLDQASKLWILHGLRLPEKMTYFADGLVRAGHIDLSAIFDLTYVENRGVSFGLFAGGMASRVLLSLLAIVVAVFVLHWAGRLHRTVAAIGAGFIVGGALGNAIDRIAYGYVVDFLDFSGLWFPWQFNIADMFINLGVACLAYDAFFVSEGTTQKSPRTSSNGTPRQSLKDADLPSSKDDRNFTPPDDL